MSESNEQSAAEPIAVIPEVLEEGVVVATCPGCGRAFGINGLRRSTSMPDYCMDCARQQRALTKAAKDDNTGWLAIAEEQGIPLWEQQPGESTEEFELWCSYRDLWPEVRPTVTKVASALRLSSNTVQRAYNKWTWAARLQAWIREVNADRVAELRESRKRMVADHISIGEKLRAKALKAVDYLDPTDVTPTELVALLKETQRFEQTARDALDAVEQATATDIDNMPAGLFQKENDQQFGNAKGLTLEDAQEVMAILAQAGVVQANGAKVGIRQTTTTEVVAGA